MQAVVPTFSVWIEAQDPPADFHCAHVVVASQHSVEVHPPAGHCPGVAFAFIEPLVQVNAEHEVMSQHDVLQLLSVFVTPLHFKVVVLLAVLPVGHVYEEHAKLSSAQQTASVEPTLFMSLCLPAVVQLYAQHFVGSHSQQVEDVQPTGPPSPHTLVHLSVSWFALSLWPAATAADEHAKPLAKLTWAKKAISKKVALNFFFNNRSQPRPWAVGDGAKATVPPNHTSTPRHPQTKSASPLWVEACRGQLKKYIYPAARRARAVVRSLLCRYLLSKEEVKPLLSSSRGTISKIFEKSRYYIF